ncbi:hypothetical protein HDU76_010605, partial [Blyttiomyces sp. JEL0837]
MTNSLADSFYSFYLALFQIDETNATQPSFNLVVYNIFLQIARILKKFPPPSVISKDELIEHIWKYRTHILRKRWKAEHDDDWPKKPITKTSRDIQLTAKKLMKADHDQDMLYQLHTTNEVLENEVLISKSQMKTFKGTWDRSRLNKDDLLTLGGAVEDGKSMEIDVGKFDRLVDDVLRVNHRVVEGHRAKSAE